MSTTALIEAQAPSRLLDVLERLVAPLAAGREDLSIWASTDRASGWVWRAPSCPWPEDDPFPGGAPEDTTDWRRVAMRGGRERGAVWVHLPEGDPPYGLAPVLCVAGQMADLEEDRDSLCEELTISHESLAALYELSADPSLMFDPERALQAIVERAITFEPGLRAIVWLIDGDRLRPARWLRTARPAPRRPRCGVVGSALDRDRAVVVNDWNGRSQVDEPELVNASRVAVSPLSLSSGVIGALEVWSEDDGVFDSRFMGLLRTLASQAAMLIDHDRLRRDQVNAARMRRELDIAATIQENLLFGRVPTEVTGLEIAALSVPSRQVDGDFYEFFCHSGHTVDVVVGDVMGKGLPAAMVAAAVKSHLLRYGSTDGVSLEQADQLLPAQEVVARVHRDIAAGLIDLDCFVTAAYARFRPDHNLLEYVDCGHTPTLHYRAATGEVVRLRQEWEGRVNLPIGMHPATRYEPMEVALGPGDVILFYSDGMTEATDPDGRMFETDSLAEALGGCAHLDPRTIAERLRDLVTSYAGESGLSDDLTCVVAKVAGGPETARLDLPAEMASLKPVREFLAGLTKNITAVDEHALYNLQLAVIETVTNIIRHAYEGGGGTFSVEARRFDARMEIHIVDRGPAFDPLAEPEPDLNEPQEGGMGIFLVRAVMDEVTYQRTPEGENRLVLIKRF